MAEPMMDADSIMAMLAQGGPEILTEEELAVVSPDEREDTEFLENLAEQLDDAVLGTLATDVIEWFDDDEESRKDWLERESDGIKMLGITGSSIGGAGFEGASQAVHPGLLEAVVQFQSRAIAELWQPNGPVNTVVMGDVTPEKDAQAGRVRDYLNYLYNERMPGAYEHHDKLLFRVGFSGCAFKKVYYCPISRGIVSRFYPAGDIVVPYSTVDLASAQRITHILKYSQADMARLMRSGVYRECDLQYPDLESTQYDQTLKRTIDDSEGKAETDWDSTATPHVVLEQSVYMDLPGYEADVPLPYLISVEKDSRKVLSIYRHWREDDPDQRRRKYLVKYGFIPGFGFYDIGLLHLLGRLSGASTGALRALLDAGQFANLPAGFRTRQSRVDLKSPIAPGEWREVDSTAEELSKAFFKLPYEEPSMTLFNLLKYLDEITRRVASTTEDLVGDNSKAVPVGTTLARIEQGLKVQTAIQKRLHRAMGEELKLVCELAAEYLPDEQYAYDVAGKSNYVLAQDFDSRIDVTPVSDPNIVSGTQRLTISQALVDMSKEAPDLFDRRAVYERMLEVMRVQNPEELMPDKTEVERMGPVEENIAMMIGKAVKAAPDQDHAAHEVVHGQWFSGLQKDDQQRLQATFIAHQAEHRAWAYLLQMQQAMGMQLPNPMAGEMPTMDPQTENMLAQLAAQSAQLLAQQSQPEVDAQAAQAAAKAQADESAMAADIRRKDMIAQADIARSDAESIARMNRENAEKEVALVSKYLSPEATAAVQQPPGAV